MPGEAETAAGFRQVSVGAGGGNVSSPSLAMWRRAASIPLVDAETHAEKSDDALNEVARPAILSAQEAIQKALNEPLTPEMERQKRNREAFADALREAGTEGLKAARQSLRFGRMAPDGTIIPDSPLADPENPTEEELRILSYPSVLLSFKPPEGSESRQP